MEKHLKFAKNVSDLLDNKFQILGVKFGFDPIVGLIPVLGDIVPAAFSSYLIWVAYKLGLPKEKISKLVFFAIADIGLGFVPFLGDFIDVTYRSHKRSMATIENHLSELKLGNSIEGEKITE